MPWYKAILHPDFGSPRFWKPGFRMSIFPLFIPPQGGRRRRAWRERKQAAKIAKKVARASEIFISGDCCFCCSCCHRWANSHLENHRRGHGGDGRPPSFVPSFLSLFFHFDFSWGPLLQLPCLGCKIWMNARHGNKHIFIALVEL